MQITKSPLTWSKIQMPAQNPAIGQAIKKSRANQRIPKMGFFAMMNDDLMELNSICEERALPIADERSFLAGMKHVFSK
jgi:hypothetical protein